MQHTRIAFLLLVVGALGHSAWAADENALAFDSYSGYFVVNTFEPDAAESFVVITSQEQFDKVFGSAFVMGDKSHRLPKDAFASNIVLAAVKRGKATWEFKVQQASLKDGTVELKYTATSKPSDSATFACPLIVSVPKGSYKAVQFVENDKPVKKIEVANPAPATQPAGKNRGGAIINEWVGSRSVQEAPRQVVVKDRKEWEELWSDVTKNRTPAPETPKGDFARQMVIAVFMGTQNSGGYAIRITGIEEGDTLTVKVKQSVPPPGAMSAAVMTAPYHVVVVAKSDKPVEFVNEK
ncbi:MAG: protease complex subunit PrcB family protein [Planctomycetota bacterium]|nr:protease complex subunit PrcB family protein [Planctomycetota bacterium]